MLFEAAAAARGLFRSMTMACLRVARDVDCSGGTPATRSTTTARDDAVALTADSCTEHHATLYDVEQTQLVLAKGELAD